MLKVLTGVGSKGYKRTKQIQNEKNMDKYTQLKMFHHGRRLQVYMYSLIYVNPETIPVEDHFPTTKNYVEN